MNVRVLVFGYSTLLWLTAIWPCPALAGTDDAPDTPWSTERILNSADAAHKAVSVLELASSEKVTTLTVSDSAAVEAFLDSLAPAALTSLNDRRVYRVTARLKFDSAVHNAETRDFEICIDSATSQLVRIESTLPSYHRKVASGVLSKRSAQEPAGGNTVADCLREGTARLPSKSPTIGFLQAWKTATGGSLWTRSDRVLAWFVTLNIPFRGLENVWYIETWPTIAPISSGVPASRQAQANKQPEPSDGRSFGCLRALVSEDGEWMVAIP